jgi:hypothetical protein
MAEQGFVITDNLRESDDLSKDSRILNNLGGEGTSGNFQLFSGNLRNDSRITNWSYDSPTATFTTNIDEGFVAFSNGTKVAIDYNRIVPGLSVEGTVRNSDGFSSFQIVDANNDPIELMPGVELNYPKMTELVRSDAVTTQNIINLKPTRLETIADTGSGGLEGNFFATEGASEQDIFNLRTISQSYDSIDSALSIYYFKKSRLPLSYEDNIFTQNVSTEGYIRVVNDDDVPTWSTSPGIFIVQDGSAERAFRNENNPWSETGTSLVTTANSTVNTLTVTNPRLTTISTVAEANNVSRASHKIPIEILDDQGNPEIYFLLLTT